MKLKFVLPAALAALAFAGCLVPSVHPLYSEKDLVFDPALLGTWGEAGDDDRYTFTRNGDKAYTWIAQENESTNVFRAHLVKLGEHRFLDAVLTRTSDQWQGVGRASVVVRPAHVFFKVELEKSSLRVRALNVEWLDDILEENPKAIAHERIREPDVDDENGRVMLTASTAELQKFILKHVEAPKAFVEGDAWRRLEVSAAK